MKRIPILCVAILLAVFLAVGAAVSAAKNTVAGDVNGDDTCNIVDVLMILRAILNDQALPEGDLTGDGKVGLTDVIRAMHLMTADTYTVTFYDSDGVTVLHEDIVYAGADATPPAAPEKEGYRFDGWDGNYLAVEKNEFVYARYTRQYTVTFADHDGSVLKTETVDAGASATAPTVDCDGFRFVGWIGEYTNVNADITVKANCVKQVTVQFMDYDGTVLDLQVLDVGTEIEYPTDPTRENYRFTGWDKTVTTATEDVVIAAQYIRRYTVTFADHDGSVLKTETVDAGASATAPTMPDNLTGYKFTDWDKDFSEVTSNLTVTAQYEIRTYTVILKAHDGTELDKQTVPHGSRFAPIEHSDTFPEMYFDWDAVVMRCFSGWSETEKITEETVVYAEYNTLYDQPVIAVKKNGSALKVSIYMPKSLCLYGIDFGFGWDSNIGVIGYTVPSASGDLYQSCGDYCTWSVTYNNHVNTFAYSWLCSSGHLAKNNYMDIFSSVTFEESDGDTLNESIMVFAEECKLICGATQGVMPEKLVSITPLIVIK